jgi:ATP-dependent Clp protease ATP-binding subunit ClpC
MPKINVYLPDELAAAVRDARLPVSGICQAALERAVRDVESARNLVSSPAEDRAAPGVFARFTPRAREVMRLAEAAAVEARHPYVGTEHVLLGVIDEGANLATAVLTSMDIELADLRAELVASMGPAGPMGDGPPAFTRLTSEALETATKEALSLWHNYIGCEHLLLGLLATEDGVASKVLRRMGVELRTTRRAVVTALSGFVHAKANAPRPAPVVEDSLREVLHRLDAIETQLAGLQIT